MPLNLAVGAEKNNTKASKEEHMAELLKLHQEWNP